MAFDKKEMARNLKLLATTPKEIERQQAAYRAKLAEIDAEERKGIWGKVTLDNRRKEARAERDRICNSLANRMKPALQFVADHNKYSETETINFEDPKLQSALRTIDFMGKDLSPADQAAIVTSFAGDIGAMRVLEKAFGKYNLPMKSACAEMRKPISQQAINEMNEVLAFHSYAASQGRFDFPIERAHWSKGEFAKQLERLSLDTTDAPDCYAAVLDTMADSISSNMDAVDFMDTTDEQKMLEKSRQQAELWKIQKVKQEIQKAQERGENPATVLNRELAKLEAPAE